MLRHPKRTAFIIREMRPGDFGDIVDNYYSYYSEARFNHSLGLSLLKKKPSIRDERKWFNDMLKELRAGNGVASVAEAEGRVVGHCGISGNQTVSKAHIGVLGIAIREGYRGMGIGNALVQDALRKGRGRWDMVVLEVFGNNIAALQLYRRSGFRVYGTLPKGIKSGRRYVDGILMYKRIGGS
ncbi:GNAT family N-acetyltransferase [Candidatus Marsarchaeota archaeon]|nr:GNAT family N-acetyltransferase [Candidatus Marsarchaeota archaeon]